MIYTASLNVPVKKALNKQVQQSNLNKICELISLDPDTTKMDVVFLGPKDLIGPKAAKVQKAIDGKHPDICVIYIYEKDSEDALLDCEYKVKCKKIKPQDITDAFEKFVGQHKVRQGKQQVSSADFEVAEGSENEVPIGMPIPNLSNIQVDTQPRPRGRSLFRPQQSASPSQLYEGEGTQQVYQAPSDTQFNPHMQSDLTTQGPQGANIQNNTYISYGPSDNNIQGASYTAGTVRRPMPPQGQGNRPPMPGQQRRPMPPQGQRPPVMPQPQPQTQQQQQQMVPPPIMHQPEITPVEVSPVGTQTENYTTGLNVPPIPDPISLEPVQKPMDTNPPVPPVLTTPEPQIPKPVPPIVGTVEDSLANMNGFEEWSMIKETLNHDSIVKSLIAENSEYVGLVNMLDVLDKRIETVWRDSALTADQKFEKIKEIGLERSVVRASTNSINVEKVISIISTIVLSAKRTVDEKVNSLDTALYKITTDKSLITDTSHIDRAIEERTKCQFELLNISRSIVDMYKSINDLITDEIKELDRKLPSSNQFINDMVKPIGTQVFTPMNTAALANRLMRALQENTMVTSQLEESVNAVIENLFELFEKDEELIRYQQNMITMLKANRVEDVIITNTLLKKVLRLYVAADNTGRSATAITWCGILSRRQNSLLIDLTGRAKFAEYGIKSVPLKQFLSTRMEEPFLCVEADHILSPTEIQELVSNLNSRLNYYPYVNIILAPEDRNGIDQLSAEALCIHYIVDCSTTSIRVMREVIENNKVENIARKLITIASPVSPLSIADSVGIDCTNTRVITLPYVSAIRACSLRHDRPYEYSDIVKIFEGAFR